MKVQKFIVANPGNQSKENTVEQNDMPDKQAYDQHDNITQFLAYANTQQYSTESVS